MESSGVRIQNAWKVSWDESIFKTPVNYTSNDAKQTWFKQDQSFDTDMITGQVGSTRFDFFDIEQGGCVKDYSLPEQYKGNWTTVAFDVLEAKKLMVIGSKPSFDGNLILTYNLETDELKEVRKDNAEPNFVTIHCLPGENPMVAASEGNNVRLFDLTTGRPLSKLPVPAWCNIICHDPQHHNLFYAACGEKVIAFDRNTKKQVRAFLGLGEDRENVKAMQAPPVPGNQIIANDRKAIKIWDTGTGKPVHTIASGYAYASSLYANIVAVSDIQGMKIYDLLESTTEPARDLPQTNQTMYDISVTPKRVLGISYNIWPTTAFDA